MRVRVLFVNIFDWTGWNDGHCCGGLSHPGGVAVCFVAMTLDVVEKKPKICSRGLFISLCLIL